MIRMCLRASLHDCDLALTLGQGLTVIEDFELEASELILLKVGTIISPIKTSLRNCRGRSRSQSVTCLEDTQTLLE